MSEDLAWDARGIQQRCSDLREVLADGVATAVELAAYWPGGAENEEKDEVGQWIYCYQQYGRLMGRLDEEKSDIARRRAEVDVMAALRRQPVKVELVARGPRGVKQFLLVHPQSYESICLIEARDRELGRLAEALNQLNTMPARAQAEWGRDLMAEIAYQQQSMVWILTTPCPGVKHLDGPARPRVPANLRALQPHDIINVLQAHRRVNAERLARVADLLGAGGKGKRKRQSWSVLGASAAREMGVTTRELFRNYTLEEWVAGLSLAADTRAQQMEQSRPKARSA